MYKVYTKKASVSNFPWNIARPANHTVALLRAGFRRCVYCRSDGTAGFFAGLGMTECAVFIFHLRFINDDDLITLYFQHFRQYDGHDAVHARMSRLFVRMSFRFSAANEQDQRNHERYDQQSLQHSVIAEADALCAHTGMGKETAGRTDLPAFAVPGRTGRRT